MTCAMLTTALATGIIFQCGEGGIPFSAESLAANQSAQHVGNVRRCLDFGWLTFEGDVRLSVNIRMSRRDSKLMRMIRQIGP